MRIYKNRAYLLDLEKFPCKRAAMSFSFRSEGDSKLEQTKDSLAYINEQILNFKKGFGNLVYVDALLTCAQIKVRKKSSRLGKKPYDFNPTVLQGPLDSPLSLTSDPSGLEEFQDYLKFIKDQAPRPLRERFIITGQHWISGDIEIDSSGKVKVFFLDSMGMEYPKTNIHPNTIKLLNKFAEIFPESEMYYSRTRRQGKGPGCSVFALDDLRHLFTVEDYLPPEYKHNLFNYLANQVPKIEADTQAEWDDEDKTKLKNPEPYSNWLLSIKVNEDTIQKRLHCVPIPLPFMRTTLSSKLYTSYVPARSESERKQPVSAKGEVLESNKPPCYFELADGSHNPINQRLIFALNKFTKQNEVFLTNTAPSEVEKIKIQFSLEGFKQRFLELKHELQEAKIASRENYYRRINTAIRKYNKRLFKWRSNASQAFTKQLQVMMSDKKSETEMREAIIKYVITTLTNKKDPKNISARILSKNKLIGFLLDANAFPPSIVNIQKGNFKKARAFTYNAASTATIMRTFFEVDTKETQDLFDIKQQSVTVTIDSSSSSSAAITSLVDRSETLEQKAKEMLRKPI